MSSNPFRAVSPVPPHAKDPAKENQWPKRLMCPHMPEGKTKVFDGGWRAYFKTVSGTTKSFGLNVGLTYAATHDLPLALFVAASGMVVATPKTVLAQHIERIWNHVQWGIDQTANGKRETLPRIFARNTSRKFATNMLDALSFCASTADSFEQLASFVSERLGATIAVDVLIDKYVWNPSKWGVIITNMDRNDPRLAPLLGRKRPIVNFVRACASNLTLFRHPPDLPLPNNRILHRSHTP